MGLYSIEKEVEIQYIRKGLYLENHPDLTETKNKFKRLVKAGWRNPLSDCKFVLEKYEIQTQNYHTDKILTDYIR